MHRQVATFPLQGLDYKEIKLKMLNRAKPFSIFLFLDSNGYGDRYGRYECLLAAGALLHASTLGELQALHKEHEDWLFGHISYDYKNDLEPKLSSRHEAQLGWGKLSFFQPEIVCYIDRDKTLLTVETLTIPAQQLLDEILHAPVDTPNVLPVLSFTKRIGHDDYIKIIEAVREHIRNGDCYEINICNEGYAENVKVDPYEVFAAIDEMSPAPFAAFYRNDELYMACSSPERYLCRNAGKLVSQPIKGTIKRGATTVQDEANKKALTNSVKDKAENVMIVDLVRNDLARSCKTGSIQVEELFGVYSFPQVHQMISTVTGRADHDKPFTDSLRYSFPMGSMTGAPKVKVMELIDRYERSRRELFSGTVGYISPNGDFDFNVIIRSLFYNESTQYLSYQTGGAITYDSNAESEWEELQLKAWALEKIFQK